MPQEIDREGRFVGDAIECGIQSSKGSGAQQLYVKFRLVQGYVKIAQAKTGEWQDIAARDEYAVGYFTLIKGDGTANTSAIENITKAWGTVFDPTAGWLPPRCQVEIKRDTFNEKTRHRVNWVYEKDSDPDFGGGRSLSDSQEFWNKHGAAIRVVSGGVQAPLQPAAPAIPSRPSEPTADAPPRPGAPTLEPVKTVRHENSTAEGAWKACVDHFAGEAGNEWKKAWVEVLGTKLEADLTPQDWATLHNAVEIPF